MKRSRLGPLALLAVAACGAPSAPADRAAAADRELLYGRIAAFHPEEFGAGTIRVRFAPSGDYVAVVAPTRPPEPSGDPAAADFTLRIWACRDGRIVRTPAKLPLYETGGVGWLDTAPRWSHAGDHLAFTLRRRFAEGKPRENDVARLLVWSPATGVAELGVVKKPRGELVVSSPCWSPDDKVVAIAHGYHEKVGLDLFDLEGGRHVEKRLDVAAGRGPVCSWSPAGPWIVLVVDGSVHVYDVDADRCDEIATLPSSTSTCNWTPPQWDATGRRVAIACARPMTIDLPEGTVHEWSRRDDSVAAITWIPGGSHWFALGERVAPQGYIGRFFRFATNPDGSSVRWLYAGAIVDGDGAVLEKLFDSDLIPPLSMVSPSNEECWFVLPWAEAALIQTIR
jgi:hypothetical protein